jgi:hypothetical protein
VINADDTGCKYRVNIRRILQHKGQKTVEVLMRDINEIMHSYATQLAIATSGKLLPAVFMCLQERSGPHIREVETLSETSVNVYVTEIKSGKLQKEATFGHRNRSACEEKQVYAN